MEEQGDRSRSNSQSGDELGTGLLKDAGKTHMDLQKIRRDATFGASTSSDSSSQEICPAPMNLAKSVSEPGSAQESLHGQKPKKRDLNPALNKVIKVFEYLVKSNEKSPSGHQSATGKHNQTDEFIQGVHEEPCVYEITRRRVIVETVKIFKCSEESASHASVDDNEDEVVAEVEKNESCDVLSKKLIKRCNNMCDNSASNADVPSSSNTSVSSGRSYPRSTHSSRLSNQSILHLTSQETETPKLFKRLSDGSVDISEEGTVVFPSTPARSSEESGGRICEYSEVARSKEYIHMPLNPPLKNKDKDPLAVDDGLDPYAKRKCVELVDQFIAQRHGKRSCGGWCNLNAEERDECLRLIMQMRSMNSDVLFVGKTYPNNKELTELRRKRKIEDKEQRLKMSEEPNEKRFAADGLENDAGPSKEDTEGVDGVGYTKN